MEKVFSYIITIVLLASIAGNIILGRSLQRYRYSNGELNQRIELLEERQRLIADNVTEQSNRVQRAIDASKDIRSAIRILQAYVKDLESCVYSFNPDYSFNYGGSSYSDKINGEIK